MHRHGHRYRQELEQHARLKRLLAEAELEKDALREVVTGKFLSPAAERRAVDVLKETLSMSQRLACKAVGLARFTYRRLPVAQTPPFRMPKWGPGCTPTPSDILARVPADQGGVALRPAP